MPWTGELLALMAAFFFAASNVAIVKGTKAGGRGDRGAMLSVGITVVVAALAWLVFEGGAMALPSEPGFWRGLAWYALAGIFAMAFGRAFLYVSIRRLGVTRSSAVKRLNPFFSVLVAAVVLGEAASGLDMGGMALIAVSFGILLQRSLGRVAREGGAPPAVDYAWGVASALSYAFAYAARKLGLFVLPYPAFGTLVGALSGLAWYGIASIFVERYRREFSGMFQGTNAWLVLAGVLMSVAQVSLFAALFYSTVTTVVMIASLEIFFAAFLSVAVFRTEPVPEARVFLAAGLATAGVIAVAAG